MLLAFVSDGGRPSDQTLQPKNDRAGLAKVHYTKTFKNQVQNLIVFILIFCYNHNIVEVHKHLGNS